jgi:hypothetical protein
MELDPDQVARYAIARATFGDTPGRTA